MVVLLHVGNAVLGDVEAALDVNGHDLVKVVAGDVGHLDTVGAWMDSGGGG